MSMIRRGLHSLVWQAHDTLLACANLLLYVSTRLALSSPHHDRLQPWAEKCCSTTEKPVQIFLWSACGYFFESSNLHLFVLLTLRLVGDRESGLFVIGELWNYHGMTFIIGQALRNHLVQCLYFSQVNQLRSREIFVIYPRPLQQFSGRIRTRIQDSCHPVQYSFWNSMYFPL